MNIDRKRRFFMKWGPVSWMILAGLLIGPIATQETHGIGAGIMLAIFWTLFRTLMVGPNPDAKKARDFEMPEFPEETYPHDSTCICGCQDRD